MTPLVIRRAEVAGLVADVLVHGGRIMAIGPGLDVPARGVAIDAGGGALLPGLHDHHVHLLAMAARAGSLDAGGSGVQRPAALDAAIAARHRELPPGRWLRVAGYDEQRGGELDRWRLDRLAPGRPVRVQHRSGALWVLSSAALDRVPLDRAPSGVEYGSDGRPTGRLWRIDDWLGQHTRGTADLDVAAVGAALVSRGVTGVTDTTPSTDGDDFLTLADACRAGELPLHVTVTGGPPLVAHEVPSPLRRGPVKIVVPDHQPLDLEELTATIALVHRAGRPVAVHCVTAVAAALTIAAWRDAGAAPGDRMEHGSVLDPSARAALADLGITVVVQPAFVHDHGDRYLRDVDPGDLPHLLPCRSLLDAGVAVGGSSDAPYGDADPWRAIATAVDRRTAGGATLRASEGLPPSRALDLYLTSAGDPGGAPRAIAPGQPADLCLLAEPLDRTLIDPAAAEVAATLVAGRVVHQAG